MGAEGGVEPDELGRATWTFLHTLAATYPASPSAEERVRMGRFLKDFTFLYPCEPCAASFREIVKKRPVENAIVNGNSLSKWMCHVHNDVNEELGKDKFDCENVTARWGACESCKDFQKELTEFKGLFKGMARNSRKGNRRKVDGEHLKNRSEGA